MFNNIVQINKVLCNKKMERTDNALWKKNLDQQYIGQRGRLDEGRPEQGVNFYMLRKSHLADDK